ANVSVASMVSVVMSGPFGRGAVASCTTAAPETHRGAHGSASPDVHDGDTSAPRLTNRHTVTSRGRGEGWAGSGVGGKPELGETRARAEEGDGLGHQAATHLEEDEGERLQHTGAVRAVLPEARAAVYGRRQQPVAGAGVAGGHEARDGRGAAHPPGEGRHGGDGVLAQ